MQPAADNEHDPLARLLDLLQPTTENDPANDPARDARITHTAARALDRTIDHIAIDASPTLESASATTVDLAFDHDRGNASDNRLDKLDELLSGLHAASDQHDPERSRRIQNTIDAVRREGDARRERLRIAFDAEPAATREKRSRIGDAIAVAASILVVLSLLSGLGADLFDTRVNSSGATGPAPVAGWVPSFDQDAGLRWLGSAIPETADAAEQADKDQSADGLDRENRSANEDAPTRPATSP